MDRIETQLITLVFSSKLQEGGISFQPLFKLYEIPDNIKVSIKSKEEEIFEKINNKLKKL